MEINIIFGDESEIQFGPKLVFSYICDDYKHTRVFI